MLITCPKCSTKYEIPDEAHLPLGKQLKCSNCQYVFTLAASDHGTVNASTEEKVETTVAEDAVLPHDEEQISATVDEPVLHDEVPQAFLPVVVDEPEKKKGISFGAMVMSVLILFALIGIGIFYRDILFQGFESLSSPSVSRQVPMAVISKPNAVVQEKLVPEQKGPAEEMQPIHDEYVEETPEIVLLPQIQSVRFEKRLDPDPTIRIEGVLVNHSANVMKLPPKVRAVAYGTEGSVLFEKEIFLTDTVLPAGEELSFFGSYQPAPDGVQWVDVTF